MSIYDILIPAVNQI